MYGEPGTDLNDQDCDTRGYKKLNWSDGHARIVPRVEAIAETIP